MTEVTRDRVCVIYDLMGNDIEINIGHVIFSSMKKMRFIEGHRYGVRGLLTQFLRRRRVENKELDYKPMVDSLLIDVTTSRSTAGDQGSILTMAERQARTDEITTKIYGLQILQLQVGERASTNEEIHAIMLD